MVFPATAFPKLWWASGSKKMVPVCVASRDNTAGYEKTSATRVRQGFIARGELAEHFCRSHIFRPQGARSQPLQAGISEGPRSRCAGSAFLGRARCQAARQSRRSSAKVLGQNVILRRSSPVLSAERRWARGSGARFVVRPLVCAPINGPSNCAVRPGKHCSTTHQWEPGAFP